jgi:agmatine deiminase
MATPRADRLRMPPEWALHESTLMAWPCRVELWGDRLDAAKREYAEVANAIGAFEPVTMVCADAGAAADARTALAGAVEVVELPIDDSWLRDNGPIFVTGDGRRAGVHFGFNSWGEKWTPWERDAAVGAALVGRIGDPVYSAPLVLEGGSIAVDGDGTLATTEQCLLNPNRNPSLSRAEIEARLRDYLGVERVVWLAQGLAEDRDTDGHIDLVAAFAGPATLLLQSAPRGNPNCERMAENRDRAEDAGLHVVEFPLLQYVELGGREVPISYLNFYVCNGAVIVPTTGAAVGAGRRSDEEALARVGAAFPGRETVGVPATTIAWGGGGPHCITQQVPVRWA